MGERIVSAEEARGLLDGATPRPWADAGFGAVCPNGDETKATITMMPWEGDTDEEGRRLDANIRLVCAAPDLAATVIALTEERDRNLDEARATARDEENAAWIAAVRDQGRRLGIADKDGKCCLENVTEYTLTVMAERDRLLSIRDDLVTDLGRQHAKLRERAKYHTFAQRIAALVAPPDAVDVAVAHLAPSDLDALAETVAAMLEARAKNGRLAGLEEAAGVCEEWADRFNDSTACLLCADYIRSLVPSGAK